MEQPRFEVSAEELYQIIGELELVKRKQQKVISELMRELEDKKEQPRMKVVGTE